MTSLNIYQKLIEVRKEVPYLQKDQQGHKFKYVASSQALGALKAKMDELGLLLVPRVLKVKVRDHETKAGGHEYFTEAWVHFTWIDAESPEDRIKCPWYGQGLDTGEKGVGKALTYAEKYFLLKFFNIATDKDDPDRFQKKTEGPNGQRGGRTDSPKQETQSKEKDDGARWSKAHRVLMAKLNNAGIDRNDFKACAGVKSMKEFAVESIEAMVHHWPKTMNKFQKWIASQGRTEGTQLRGETAQGSPLIMCPRKDNLYLNKTECDECKERQGCPSWLPKVDDDIPF